MDELAAVDGGASGIGGPIARPDSRTRRRRSSSGSDSTGSKWAAAAAVTPTAGTEVQAAHAPTDRLDAAGRSESHSVSSIAIVAAPPAAALAHPSGADGGGSDSSGGPPLSSPAAAPPPAPAAASIAASAFALPPRASAGGGGRRNRTHSRHASLSAASFASSIAGTGGGAAFSSAHSSGPSPAATPRRGHSRAPSAVASFNASTGSGSGRSSSRLDSILALVHSLADNAALDKTALVPAPAAVAPSTDSDSDGVPAPTESRVHFKVQTQAEQEQADSTLADPPLSAGAASNPSHDSSMPHLSAPSAPPRSPSGGAVTAPTDTACSPPMSRLLSQLHTETLVPGVQADVRTDGVDGGDPANSGSSSSSSSRRLEDERTTQECLATIRLPVGMRSAAQSAQLLSWMRGHRSALLRGLQPRALADLCERVGYRRCEGGEVVVRQGDPSDAMYIVVAGSVSVWIAAPSKGDARTGNNDASGHEHSIAASAAASSAAADDAEVFHHNSDLIADASDDAEAGDRDPSLGGGIDDDDAPSGCKYRRPVAAGLAPNQLFVGLLSAGDERSTFGELGLVSGETRSATVKAEGEQLPGQVQGTGAELLVVRAHDFHTVLREYAEGLTRKVRLLASFPNFHNTPGSGSGSGRVSEAYLRKLSMHLSETVYTAPRTLVFAQGARADRIFFLVEGEAELLQTVQHVTPAGHTRQVQVVLSRVSAHLPPHLRRNPSRPVAGGEGEESESVGDGIGIANASDAAPTTAAPSSFSSPSSSSSSSSSGQILGESNLFQRSLRGLYDCSLRTCAGACTFLVISRADFLRRISTVILSRFQARWKEKIGWRERRVRQIRVPAESLVPGTTGTTAAGGAAGTASGGATAKMQSQTSQSARGPGGKTGADAATVLSLHAPSLRRAQLQLASHRNFRLLPALTASSGEGGSSGGGGGGHGSSSARAAGSVTALHALEQAALPSSPSRVRRQMAAAAQRRAEIARTRELDDQRRVEQSRTTLQSQREQREWELNEGQPVPPPLVAPLVPPLSLPLLPGFDSSFSYSASSSSSSPLTSVSRSLVAAGQLNPTLLPTRRGSMGLAPELRPSMLLASVQPDHNAGSSRRAGVNGDVAAAGPCAQGQIVPMPHSLPRSLQSFAHPAYGSTVGQLQSQSARAPGLARSPSASLLASQGGYLSSSSSSSSLLPVSLSAEQHLVLSTQLRSTDARTRARRIVALMREMRERQQEWTVTNKAQGSGSGGESGRGNPDSALRADGLVRHDGEAEAGASRDDIEHQLSLLAQPLNNAREMWQMRQLKRDRTQLLMHEGAGGGGGGGGGSVSHSSGPNTDLPSWQHLNPLQSSSASDRGARNKKKGDTKAAGVVQGPGLAPLHPAANSAHPHAHASPRDSSLVLPSSSGVVSAARPALTPTLLRDLLRIAPRSSVLQEALALNARARNTLTHKGSFAGARARAHDRQRSNASVDWTANALHDFARHGQEGSGLDGGDSAASLGLHLGSPRSDPAHAPLGKRLGHTGSAAALQAAHRDLLEFTEAGGGRGVGVGGPGGGDADGYGDDPHHLHSSSSFALLKLAMVQDAQGSGAPPAQAPRNSKRSVAAAATAAVVAAHRPPVPASLLSLSSLMSSPLADSGADEHASTADRREPPPATQRVPLHYVRVDLDGAEPVLTGPPPVAPAHARRAHQRKHKQQTHAQPDPPLPSPACSAAPASAASPPRCGPLLRSLHPVVRLSLGAEHLPPPSSKALHPRTGKGYQPRVRYA